MCKYAYKLPCYKQLTSHESDYSHALRIHTVCTQDTYCMHSGYVLYALNFSRYETVMVFADWKPSAKIYNNENLGRALVQ